MVDDANDVPPGAKGRRRKPPVLDLEATDISAAEPRTGNPDEEPARAAEAEERGIEWRALLRLAPAALAVSAIVGIVAAVLVVIAFDRGADPRSAKLAADMAALAQRLDALPKASVADPAALPALGTRLDGLAAAVSAAEKRVTALESRPAPAIPPMPDLSPLAARIGRLEAAAVQRKASELAAADALAKRIDALEQRVGALSAEARAAVAPALAAEIVAIGALRDAMHSGAPFVTELTAVRALLGERAGKLQSLEKSAASGLPTMAQLTQQFAELAPKLAREMEPDGSYLERLKNSASRLVEVRPAGEIKGESALALATRIEARLRHNDLDGALTEAEMLPPPAKAAAAAWIATARAKRDGDRVLRELIAASLSMLGERKP